MPVLTETLVQRARPRARKYEVSCALIRGFHLRVLPSGKKAYYVRLRRDGRDLRERLGSVDELTLEEAQAQARARLREGRATPERVEGEGMPVAPRAAAEPPPRTATPAKRGLLLRQLIPRYLAQHVDIHLKPDTQVAYRSYAQSLLQQFGGDALVDIDPERVERWHGSMRDTPCAANKSVRVLSHMFTKAIEWGLIPHTHRKPTDNIRMFRERRRERFLTPEERRRLEAVLQEAEAKPSNARGAIRWSMAAAIRLLALTGMRRGEVLSLTWSMVDLRHRCFRLPDSKTGQRAVPFGSPVVDLLRELEPFRRPHCPYVVYSQQETKIRGAALGRSWEQIRERAGLPGVRLHDLRHSAASDAIMSGVPLAVVGKIL
ncbi:MAG: site-specific integrase, partial [Myxococcales bacterium]|nr:site-specific integrase [Myxococcales bacterium]